MADHKQPILCGVDVAQRTLDIAHADGTTIRIPNTLEAISDWLDTLRGPARIAVEATGCYHELLQVTAIAVGHEVFLLNGRQLNHYREAVGQRAKTDPDDARLLLRYLTHEQAQLKPAKVLTIKEKRLWSLLQRRATLVKTRSQIKLSLAGDGDTRGIAKEITATLTRSIARLDQLMKHLARDLGWEGMIKRCQSIPGIGPLNALALVTCYHRGDFKQSDQWIAYMGLDVRVRDSGTHRGKRRLSKRGNPELRRLLFNGAMSASKMQAIRPRYEAYRERGMSSTAALVALSRKLARIAFALLSTGGVYDEKMSGLACARP